MDFFSMDNPLMVFLGKVADLVVLNLLTLVLCIPLVTAGASLTAMHYVALKMFREEGSSILGMFWHSFRLNLRQGTLLWGILLVPGLLILTSLMVVLQNVEAFPPFLGIALIVSFLLLYMIGTSAFTLLSRYDNTIGKTLYNAAALTFSVLPKSLLILLMHAAPFVLMYYLPPLLPLAMLFLLSGPAIGTAWLLDPSLRKLEGLPERPQDEPEREWHLEPEEPEGMEEPEKAEGDRES